MRIKKHLIILIITTLLVGCATTGPKRYDGKSAQEVLAMGDKALMKNDYPSAISAFEAVSERYPFGPAAQRAQLNIIYAYYENGDFGAALAAAERYIRLYPLANNVDYAFYMKGLVNFGRGQNWAQKIFGVDRAKRDLTYLQQSFADFNELLRRFPASRYVPDARRRMIYIRNILARYNLDVAQFYMKRKAYVAAANRASYIVRHFQGSPEVRPALKVMVKAYNKLGEYDLAHDAYKVLQASS